MLPASARRLFVLSALLIADVPKRLAFYRQFSDYRTNVPLYPEFQAFFRKYQPPTLIVWCKNDFIFPPEGARPYQRDLQNVETHLLDVGHFALETHGEEIAVRIEEFLQKQKLAS
jgi:pimeloyl-ACP methyl ester carboxylesterase